MPNLKSSRRGITASPADMPMPCQIPVTHPRIEPILARFDCGRAIERRCAFNESRDSRPHDFKIWKPLLPVRFILSVFEQSLRKPVFPVSVPPAPLPSVHQGISQGLETLVHTMLVFWRPKHLHAYFVCFFTISYSHSFEHDLWKLSFHYHIIFFSSNRSYYLQIRIISESELSL